jgi:hypothetical protein
VGRSTSEVRRRGIPAEEIREILSNAGFEEIRGSETRSRLAGPMFDARLRRK